MSKPEWSKRSRDEPIWEGPRVVEEVDLSFLDEETRVKVATILDSMDWPELIIFRYGDSDRVVAPFVVGISRDMNPLMRGYQIEGESRSGKGPGWRVFQIRLMENVDSYQDFFDPNDFVFDEVYPWVYKVYKML